jgi:hypothetical protein
MLCSVALLNVIKLSGGVMGLSLTQLYLPPTTYRSHNNSTMHQVIFMARRHDGREEWEIKKVDRKEGKERERQRERKGGRRRGK